MATYLHNFVAGKYKPMQRTRAREPVASRRTHRRVSAYLRHLDPTMRTPEGEAIHLLDLSQH